MSSLQGYIDLDLSQDGDLAKSLFDQVELEAQNRSFSITPAGKRGTMSEGLTDAMSNWLNRNIGPVRNEALAEMEAHARAIRIGDAVEGRIIEIKQDEIEQERAGKTARLGHEFYQSNKNLVEKRDEARNRFQIIKTQEGGREPKIPNKLLEWGILVPAILAPEGLLNFESFRRAPIIQSDAMALGATLLVGIGIAVAAYCIGLYIRQINYFTRKDDEYRSKSGWPLIFWGLSLLIVSIGSVAVARYYYMQPLIQEAIILGQAPPNLAFSIGSLLFGNLICFIVGAVITFFFNDPNPQYSEIAATLKKLDSEVESKKSKGLTKKLNEINGRATQNMEQEKKLIQQMEAEPGYADMRRNFSKLESQDMKIVGVLGEYKTRLLSAARPEARFEQRDLFSDPADPARSITRERFASTPIKLYLSQPTL